MVRQPQLPSRSVLACFLGLGNGGTGTIIFYIGHRSEDQGTLPSNRACSTSSLMGFPRPAKEPMSTIISTREFRMPQSLFHPSSHSSVSWENPPSPSLLLQDVKAGLSHPYFSTPGCRDTFSSIPAILVQPVTLLRQSDFLVGHLFS